MLNFDHRPLQIMLSGSTVVGITLTVVSVSPSTVQRSNHLIHRNGTSTIQGPKAIKHKQTSHLSLFFLLGCVYFFYKSETGTKSEFV